MTSLPFIPAVHLPKYARVVLEAAWQIRQPPEPITTGELVRAAGYQRSTVNRAIRHLRAADLWPWRRFAGRPGCRIVEPDADVDSIPPAAMVGREYRPDIAAACAAIRAGWTDAQRASRAAVPVREWAVPGVGGAARRWNGDTMGQAR